MIERTGGGPAEKEASLWLARRDRGLSSEERAAFQAWLDADPAHAEAVATLEVSWRALNSLRGLGTVRTGPPNPDLLAPSRPRRAWGWLAAAGAAAALVLLLAQGRHRPPPAPTAAAAARILSDHSRIQPGPGAALAENFSPWERRISLHRGRATFFVSKDPNRPFIVAAAGISVRAVGTVFEVGIEADRIRVEVTEGRVTAGDDTREAVGRREIPIAAGESVDFPRDGGPAVLTLVFAGEPLSRVVDAFNRHNRAQVAVENSRLGALRISGRFRADNIDAFLRLSKTSFGLRTRTLAEGKILLFGGGQ